MGEYEVLVMVGRPHQQALLGLAAPVTADSAGQLGVEAYPPPPPVGLRLTENQPVVNRHKAAPDGGSPDRQVDVRPAKC
jgi:hypothetical protein